MVYLDRYALPASPFEPGPDQNRAGTLIKRHAGPGSHQAQVEPGDEEITNRYPYSPNPDEASYKGPAGIASSSEPTGQDELGGLGRLD